MACPTPTPQQKPYTSPPTTFQTEACEAEERSWLSEEWPRHGPIQRRGGRGGGPRQLPPAKKRHRPRQRKRGYPVWRRLHHRGWAPAKCRKAVRSRVWPGGQNWEGAELGTQRGHTLAARTCGTYSGHTLGPPTPGIHSRHTLSPAMHSENFRREPGAYTRGTQPRRTLGKSAECAPRVCALRVRPRCAPRACTPSVCLECARRVCAPCSSALQKQQLSVPETDPLS